MTTVLRRYSIAFKRAIVAEVEAGQYTAVEAAKVHGVNYVSVYKWLKEHGGPSSQTRIVRVEMPDERTGLKELEKRNRELERALANAQIKEFMTLEASLEILEERTGQRIKKKDRFTVIQRLRGKALNLSDVCRVLKISRQAVYQRATRTQQRGIDERLIVSEVHRLRRQMPRIGTRKLYDQLRGSLQSLGVGRDRFFDILRRHKLLVRPRKRFMPTTNSRHTLPVRPNLLTTIRPERANQVWVADQTYLRLTSGFCYLSLVTDLWSRKIIGYDVYPTLEAEGPLRALRMALWQSASGHQIVHHSDRGVQYCCAEYAQLLATRTIVQSMSAPGCPYHNAVAERVNGILKTEFYLDKMFQSLKDAQQAVAEAVRIYNTLRPHLSLGMMTPELKHAA